MNPIAENETGAAADLDPKRYQEKNCSGSSILTARKGPEISVALLTAGTDKHYTYGLATALASRGVVMDVIGSDELEGPELRGIPRTNFLNLRGDHRHDAGIVSKILRILRYYAKLMGYAATSKPKVFHILWNNKFELFDRTFLTLYYKLLGKKVVLTAHNVNKRRRDASDTRLNRLTLRVQYHLADHIFVHTQKMKAELTEEFGVPDSRVAIIPFGINNAVPSTSLSPAEAKQRLGILHSHKTILFFGQITPYKGLDYLIEAFRTESAKHNAYRLIIAGRPKPEFEEYWRSIENDIRGEVRDGRILVRAEFIPDTEIEVFLKCADVLALPYRHIYQSGVLFLGYSFGLPVLAADVGSLKEDIIEGETGFVFRPDDAADLANAIDRYFASDLFANLTSRRELISRQASRQHSWDTVSDMTVHVYSELLSPQSHKP